MKRIRPLFFASVSLLTTISAAQAQIWDPGTAGMNYFQTGLSTTSTFLTVQDSSILGGERDVYTSWGVGTSSTRLEFDDVGWQYGTHYIASSWSSAQSGVTDFVWDGVDGSAAINYTGLGGVNLGTQYAGIQFGLEGDPNDISWNFYFYTDADHYSTYSVFKPGTISWTSPQPFSANFSAFTAAGSLGGADFSNIGAIRLVIDGSQDTGVDASIHGLQYIAVPEPSGAMLFGLTGIATLFRRRRRA